MWCCIANAVAYRYVYTVKSLIVAAALIRDSKTGNRVWALNSEHFASCLVKIGPLLRKLWAKQVPRICF